MALNTQPGPAVALRPLPIYFTGLLLLLAAERVFSSRPVVEFTLMAIGGVGRFGGCRNQVRPAARSTCAKDADRPMDGLADAWRGFGDRACPIGPTPARMVRYPRRSADATSRIVESARGTWPGSHPCCSR